MPALSADVITAVLGGEGIASVVAAVSAWRAHSNSKQLKHNSGSTVADAVSRIEAGLSQHGEALDGIKARLDVTDDRLAGLADDVREERKARMLDSQEIARIRRVTLRMDDGR